MSNNPVKAIIWDLDGTIIHFKIDYIKARRAAIKILKKFGISKKKLTIKKSIFENVRTAREIFRSMDLSAQEIEEIVGKIDSEVEKIEHEAAQIATMISGIDHVLEFIKSKKIKQAIYTLNTSRNAEHSLEKIGLSKYFELIAGRDNVNNPKPHPDHLLYICKKLNVNPSEILVIGDTARDIEGALNVGARSIAIENKISKITDLKIFFQADKIINENEIPSNLINILEELI